jgi:hypothetical protein
MKNMLLLAILLLLIIIIYKNRSLLQEGKKNRRRKGKSRKGKSRKGKSRKGKSRKGKSRKGKKNTPFMAWDGDKYKSCDKCCNDDDGCYDSRCFGKCSKSSFKHASGKRKRGPLRP